MTELVRHRGRWKLLGIALALAIVATPNVYLVGRSVGIILSGAAPVDFGHFVEAGRRVFESGLYEITADYGYRYSPMMAYLFALIGPMGGVAWRLLHLAAALALPTWPMRIVTLLSWPFWFDVEAGNLMVFVLLAAAWALRGNRWGIIAFLLMSVLVPRPLMLPILAWILWRQSEWRTPFIAIFAVHAALVVASGWGGEWVAVLAASSDELTSPLNLAPSRWVGMVWLVAAVPAAILLTVRGRLGWASLLASPYWLPYYLMMPILEFGRATPEADVQLDEPSGQGSRKTTRSSA